MYDICVFIMYNSDKEYSLQEIVSIGRTYSEKM